jgi:hypothetical protein
LNADWFQADRHFTFSSCKQPSGESAFPVLQISVNQSDKDFLPAIRANLGSGLPTKATVWRLISSNFEAAFLIRR